MPGFVAWIGVVIANRMFTITAWEDAEALAQLRRDGTHPEAMEKFFASELGSSAMTSVWKPEAYQHAVGAMRRVRDDGRL